MKITASLKALFVILSLAMVFSLFACGEEINTLTEAQGTDAETEASTDNGTEGDTEAPTNAKTEAPTSEVTEAPTGTETEGETTEDETTETTTETETETETDESACDHDEVAIDGYAATCTTNGLTDGKKCSKCDEILVPQTTITAPGHTEETIAAIAPTCMTTGLTEGKKCSVCNEITVAQQELAITPDNHALDNGTPTEATKCGEKATVTYSCTVEGCDYTSTIEGEVLNHDMDEGVQTSDPTCTTNGVITYSCNRDGCDYETTKQIDSLGHIFEETNRTPATCSATGTIFYECARNGCEEPKTETIDIITDAHNWNEGTVTKDPSCIEKGVITYTCTHNSEHTKTEDIDMVDHTKERQPATNGFEEYDKCAVCGAMWNVAGESIEAPVPALGNIANPDTLTALKEYTVTAHENGYFYKWTAVGAGKLVVTMITADNWTFSINSTAYNAENAANGMATVNVSKGDVVEIMVGTADGTAAPITFKTDYFYGATGEQLAVVNPNDAILQSRDEEGNLVITNNVEVTSAQAAVDVTFELFNNVHTAGRFVLITYKTSNASSSGHMQGTAADGTTIGWKSYSFTTVKDGEWYTAIVDVWAVLGEGATLRTFRFDCCEVKDTAVSITFKRVEVIEAEEIVTDKLNLNYNGLEIGRLTFYNSHATPNFTEDQRYVTVSRMTGQTNCYANFYPKATVEGRYFVVKYKTTGSLNYFTIYTSTTNNGNTAGDQFQSPRIVNDGEWHYMVIDLARGKTFTANESGEYWAKYLRIDIPAIDVDFAYMGIHDDLDFICDELDIPAWGNSGSDLKYHAAHGGSAVNITRDGDGNITVTSTTSSGDCGIRFFDGNEQVVGRYLVITVKANNGSSTINNLYIQDHIGKAWSSFEGISAHLYVDEWVTVIIDTHAASNYKENSNIFALRVDCCESGADKSLTFKSIETYEDVNDAIASAGDNHIFTRGFEITAE